MIRIGCSLHMVYHLLADMQKLLFHRVPVDHRVHQHVHSPVICQTGLGKGEPMLQRKAQRDHMSMLSKLYSATICVPILCTILLNDCQTVKAVSALHCQD